MAGLLFVRGQLAQILLAFGFVEQRGRAQILGLLSPGPFPHLPGHNRLELPPLDAVLEPGRDEVEVRGGVPVGSAGLAVEPIQDRFGSLPSGLPDKRV